MDKERNRPSILKGHTPDDKFKSVESHLQELYRMKGSMARPEAKTIPVIIPAYGESASKEKDKIYSAFATRYIKLQGAMINIDCAEKDNVYLELEIIRESGLIDSYAKSLGKGIGAIPFSDLVVATRDIINVYMTYVPYDLDKITSAGVTATLYGDTVI